MALRGKDAQAIVGWAVAELGASKVALASSLGPEDQVLTEMLVAATDSPRIFTLDTGRLFPETYELMARTMATYGIHYEVSFPDADELGRLISEHGPNLFYRSQDLRRACCKVRKVHPLRKVLATLDGWICGLRRDQGPTRTETPVIAWDSEHGLFKICPLAAWTADEVWAYLRERDIPTNALHARGFRSIGCAPCTRALEPGEEERAGRWWWEDVPQRECGLHLTAPAAK